MVALFIRDSITFKIRTDIVTDICEQVFIEISGSKKGNTIVAAIFRALNTDLQLFIYEFENELQTVTGKNTNCVLAEDYNINLLNQTNNDTTHFIDMSFTYCMLPEIKTPTRYGEHGMTLIDNIFTNKLNDLSAYFLCYW